MKLYTIIAGVNGVGKSSLTGALKGERSDLGIVVDTDMITAQLGGDKLRGGKAAIALINKSLEMGVNFTQETTLSGVKTLRTIKKARALGYTVRLYYVGVNSAEESIKRIKNRVEKGGHDIPEGDVIRRYSKRFDDLVAVLPYCSEVRLYDNENGFIEKAEYKNGTLIIKSEHVPGWLNELQDRLKSSAVYE